MTGAELRSGLFHDAANFGVRVTVGVIFIYHSLGKFEPGFVSFLDRMGMPDILVYPIGLGELVPGILLIAGVLTRASSAVLAAIMIGAIFVVKGAAEFGGDRGVEFDLILLAAALLVMVAGPGRMSLANAVKRIPRPLH